MLQIVDLITMGCSKNLVDSEKLMYQLRKNGYQVFHNPKRIHRQIAIVNTCGFINDAKEESIGIILELCKAKEEGRLKKLLVTGCLSERFFHELNKEIPQVDKYYGKFNYDALIRDLGKNFYRDNINQRILSTPGHYAYVKISEGCDRQCAYCAIPIITGAHKSRPIEDILEEIRMLVAQGVKEFQIIAQELTFYGLDLYGSRKIAELTERISDIPGVEWIRLHYAYPQQFPDDLLRVMRERNNVCKYLDIALQHISDNVLSNMRRHINKEETLRLIERIRREVPGIHLRTTLMVGFPGEGEVEFEELKEFVQSARFERMGAFAYCEEEDTYAAKNYVDEIPQEVKDERLDEIMALQEKISLECNEKKTGHIYRVIVDREESDYYVGRTEYDSPEVDPEVLIKKTRKLAPGEFYDVCIDSALPFELIGTVVEAE